MNVANLKPGMKNITIRVRVVNVFPPREVVSRKDGTPHTLQEVLVGDSTGSVLLTLWDGDVNRLEEGRSYEINGYTTLVRGSLRVNVGRKGSITAIEDDITANTSNNVSEREWEDRRRRRHHNT